MSLEIFSTLDKVEVWPTFHTRVLPVLVRNLEPVTTYRAIELEDWSYDSYVLKQNPLIKTVPVEFVASWLQLQSDGQPGAFSTKGNQNVVFLDTVDEATIALQARYGKSYYRQNCNVWSVLAWRHPKKGVWPDWGSYRDKGTRYLFPT